MLSNKLFLISPAIQLQILYFKKKKFLIIFTSFVSKKYIFIPTSIVLGKQNKHLLLSTKVQSLKNRLYKIIILNCFKQIALQLRLLKKKSFKIILIRGVGLRILFLVSNSTILQLKLGLSHLILLPIPSTIKILIFKRRLIISGFNPVEVGNFSKKLVALKALNIYTGKGLWLKNIKKFYCKAIKKR